MDYSFVWFFVSGTTYHIVLGYIGRPVFIFIDIQFSFIQIQTLLLYCICVDIFIHARSSQLVVVDEVNCDQLFVCGDQIRTAAESRRISHEKPSSFSYLFSAPMRRECDGETWIVACRLPVPAEHVLLFSCASVSTSKHSETRSPWWMMLLA